MAFRISTGARDAIINAFTALLTQGGNPAVSNIIFYTGSQPATPATTATGTILATVNFAATAFAASSGQSASANSTPLTASVATSGTPGWCRFWTGAASPVAVCDCSVTINGGGGDVTFDNITWVSGGTVSISSLAIAEAM